MTSDRMEPLSGQGAAVALAKELRERKRAANITLKQMAANCSWSTRALSEAANGRAVPTWDVTEAFLTACDVPPAEREVVRKLWDEAWVVSDALRPAELKAKPTPEAVVRLLKNIMSSRGVTVEDLSTHLDDIRPPIFKAGNSRSLTRPGEAGAKRRTIPKEMETWTRPSQEYITASLETRTQPLNVDLLILALAACGASHDDILYWRKHAGDAISTTPQPGAVAAGHGDTALSVDPSHPDTSYPSVAANAVHTTVETAHPTDPTDAPVNGWLAATSSDASPHPATSSDAALHGGSSSARSSWRSAHGDRLKYLGLTVTLLLSAVGVITAVRSQTSERTTAQTPRTPDDQPVDHASGLPTTQFPTAPLPQAPRPARVTLTKIAAAVAQLPATKPGGPIVYTHATVWRLDDSLDSDEPFTIHDEQRWRRPDGTGILRITDLPPDGPELPSRPLPPTSTHELTPTRAGVAAIRPADDPGILEEQLGLNAHEPGTDSAVTTLAAITALYQHHCLQPPQRAAALALLADTGSLQASGQDQDRLGRTGISVTATTDTRQHRALLNPATGELLSIETLTLPGRNDHITAPTVTEAIVIHPCSYRASLN